MIQSDIVIDPNIHIKSYKIIPFCQYDGIPAILEDI